MISLPFISFNGRQGVNVLGFQGWQGDHKARAPWHYCKANVKYFQSIFLNGLQKGFYVYVAQGQSISNPTPVHSYIYFSLSNMDPFDNKIQKVERNVKSEIWTDKPLM